MGDGKRELLAVDSPRQSVDALFRKLVSDFKRVKKVLLDLQAERDFYKAKSERLEARILRLGHMDDKTHTASCEAHGTPTALAEMQARTRR